MIPWIPVIETVYNQKRTGSVTLAPRGTEVLPRIGEAVGFPDDENCRALKLRHDISHVPRVTDIHHSLVGSEMVTQVFIEMTTMHDAASTDKYAEKNGINWGRYSPEVASRA